MKIGSKMNRVWCVPARKDHHVTENVLKAAADRIEWRKETYEFSVRNGFRAN